MLLFGTAVSSVDLYERIGLPSIQRIAEPGSRILTRVGYDSIQRPYNEMLDEACAEPDLEALVLIHQDLELTDGSLAKRIRPLLTDPRTGLIGLMGGRGVPPHRWASWEDRYGRSVGPGVDIRHTHGPQEVEFVDGMLLVLAPWVVRSLCFDERLAADFHGYDLDFGFRVRAARGRVFCVDAPYFHHIPVPWRDRAEFVRAGVRLAKRWDPALRPPEWQPSFAR